MNTEAKMLYSKDERINSTVKCLLRAGWQTNGRNKHFRLTNGQITITVPHSPSDHRAALNWRSQIRRAGVDLAALGC